MSKNDDEQYLDFLRYQEVKVKHVVPKSDRTVTKADRKFLAKAAKNEAKRDGGKRGRR
jgi:GTP-binding protein EngB required for normal cell division